MALPAQTMNPAPECGPRTLSPIEGVERIHGIPMPAVLVDGAQRILACNAAFRRLYQAEAAGHRLDQLATLPSGSAGPAELILADGRTQRAQVWWAESDILLFQPQYNGDDRAELAHALSEARETLAAQASFIAEMAHEVRTPLNAIIGFSEILARETRPATPGTITEYGTYINTAARQLNEQLTDIMFMARISAGTVAAERQRIGLFDSVETALRSFLQRDQLPQNIVSWRPQAEDQLILGDPALLHQLFHHAFDLALEDGAGRGVHVDATVSEGMVQLRICSAPILDTPISLDTRRKLRSARARALSVAIIQGLIAVNRGQIGLDGTDQGLCILLGFEAACRSAD